MAKASRAANQGTTVQSGASLLDVLNAGEASTLESLKTNTEGESEFSESSFQPIEEALPISELRAKPVKRQAVIIKPVSQSKFRLGLENTAENYRVFPGTRQRWAPKKKGNVYRTGLDRPELAPTPEERKTRIAELEDYFGHPLNGDFYRDLTFKIDLNKPLGEKLYLDRPEDLVIYLAMLESDDVANGLHEYQNGSKPMAVFYIENKEAEAERDAQERRDKRQASNLFDSISPNKRRKVARILGVDVEGLTDLATETTLWKWIDDDPKTRVLRSRLFVDLVEKGDSYLAVADLVKTAVNFHIIRKTSTNDFFYGDTMIGTTESQIIDKLLSTHYSDLRLGIQTKVELKLNQL